MLAESATASAKSVSLPARSENNAPAATAKSSVDPTSPEPDTVTVKVVAAPSTPSTGVTKSMDPPTIDRSVSSTVDTSTGSLKLSVNSTVPSVSVPDGEVRPDTDGSVLS